MFASKLNLALFLSTTMQNVDLFFLLLGAVLVLAMHAGFAFLS
jgi:Amt family ammonium transporter